MNIDKFIKMGHSHTLFEDAVITRSQTQYGATPYLIVCDGCSDSENTHIGSHLLARSAQVELESNDGLLENSKESIIFRARSMADVMGLDYSALDATLLIAYIQDDMLKIEMHGDGCLYYKADEVEHTYKIQYFENMPYYLSYLLHNGRNKAYHLAVENALEKGDDLKRLMHWKNDVPYHEDSNVFTPVKIELPLEGLDYVILSTDGVESLIPESGVTLTSVDTGLHAFKNFNGDFLQRKVKRVLKEESKKGHLNQDDLGLAAIYFGEG